MQGDFAPVNIVLEVVELDIDVLGAWAHLWDLGNFECTAVVLKDLAMDCWLGRDHVKTLPLELFDKLHDWDLCMECGQQTYELALCGA